MADVGGFPINRLASWHRIRRETRGAALRFWNPPGPGRCRRGYRPISPGCIRLAEGYRTAQRAALELQGAAKRLDPVLHALQAAIEGAAAADRKVDAPIVAAKTYRSGTGHAL